MSLVAHRAPGASIERADPEAAIEAGAAAELPIGELSPRGTVEAARYRPNLVFNTDFAGFVENGWVDEELVVGEEVVLRHNRLEVLGQAATGCAGVYAEVVRPGTVRAGDPVRLGRVS